MERINQQLTFDSYVTDASNGIAVRILRQAAENPGQELYNPLYLYGSSGAGKTHLLHSVANHISANQPQLKVRYLTGESFVRELVQAVRSGRERAFREALREGVDVLLMDDVQYLAGKGIAQEVFFHLFDALYENGKQIILASDRRPDELYAMEERVRCQFSGGILLGLEQKGDSHNLCDR